MLKWFGQQVIENVHDVTADKIEKGARALVNHIKIKLSVDQPFERRGKPGNRRLVGLAPSAPGQYPRKLSGHLHRNVVSEHDREGLVSRVGTNVLYGKFLQLGTRFMMKRPWLSKAIMEFRGKLARIIGTA